LPLAVNLCFLGQFALDFKPWFVFNAEFHEDRFGPYARATGRKFLWEHSDLAEYKDWSEEIEEYYSVCFLQYLLVDPKDSLRNRVLLRANPHTARDYEATKALVEKWRARGLFPPPDDDEPVDLRGAVTESMPREHPSVAMKAPRSGIRVIFVVGLFNVFVRGARLRESGQSHRG